jgi:hypothetical protein
MYLRNKLLISFIQLAIPYVESGFLNFSPMSDTVPVLDSDLPVLRIRIRIRIRRIHMFLGLQDPDPLVRDMDPDPFIIRGASKRFALGEVA